MYHDEVPFFENPDYLENDISRLEALFKPVTTQKAIGIKRPGYLGRPECTARIYEHVPEARLIAILRNPISRAISAYYHSMRSGFIPIKPIEEGLTHIIDGKYDEQYPQAQEIIGFGLYHQHLRRYLEYFDRNKLLVLLFDAIKENPLESIQQLYRFVGVRDDYEPRALKQRKQQNPGVYSLTRLKFLSIRNPIIYTYYHHGAKRIRKPATLFRRLVDRSINELDLRLLASIYGNPKPTLSETLKLRLFQIYEADVNNLEDFLGQSLTAWKSQIPTRAT